MSLPRSPPTVPVLALVLALAGWAPAPAPAAVGSRCPGPCLCLASTLSCTGLSPAQRLRRLPHPKARNLSVTILDFRGNSISTIEDKIWKAYPWAESLTLRDNDLSELHKNSFNGLLTLKYLDASCNKIQVIEKYTFEPLPFLQFLNLSCNLLTELSYGTFQAWHGMQFLQKLILSRNPLVTIEDPSFFDLPSLKYLLPGSAVRRALFLPRDMDATQVTLKVIQSVLMMSLKLETMILPENVACCLCQFKRSIEIVCKIIKLQCDHLCVTNVTLCDVKEPLDEVKKEFVQVLESRKKNTSSLLTLRPQGLVTSSGKTQVPWLQTPNKNTHPLKDLHLLDEVHFLIPKLLSKDGAIREVELKLLPFIRLLNLNLQSQRVTPSPPSPTGPTMASFGPMHLDLTDKGELRKLYLLTNLLAADLREKIYNAEHAERETLPGLFFPENARPKLQGLGKDRKRSLPLAGSRPWDLATRNHGNREGWHPGLGQGVGQRTGGREGKGLGETARGWGGVHPEIGRPLRPRPPKRRRVSGSPRGPRVRPPLRAPERKKLPGPALSLPLQKQPIPISPLTSLPQPTSLVDVKNQSNDLIGKILIVLKNTNKTDTVKAMRLEKVPEMDIVLGEEGGPPAATPSSKEPPLLQMAKPTSGNMPADLRMSQAVVNRSWAGERTRGKGSVSKGALNLGGLFWEQGQGAVSDNASNLGDPTLEQGLEEALDSSLPNIQKMNETHWVFHEEKSDHPTLQTEAPPPDNSSNLGDQFEKELDWRLQALIPNKAVRKLIAHVIRTLKVDCTEPEVQLACAKLLSKTGLLMKLLSEREEADGSQLIWNSGRWRSGDYFNDSADGNLTADEDARELSQDIPSYGYGNKLLLAISVTVVIMTIIAAICLIEICSQRSSSAEGAKRTASLWSFKRSSQALPRQTSEKDNQAAKAGKPLWLRDMYRPLDSTRKKNMAQKLHDRDSSDEEEIYSKESLR
ncbi:leucine-rich repeat-containing protein 37A2-like isoform X1 [Tachyglossus aculeatus]|uniref:leucine-rich repeat-containing protein 37A2-like isoform X1 n=1 Tax=Tachyglossus aculeatus TaxID=9261 RepID=UPI0018F6DFD1|nr:leucine-rich repeat-containing protein 37A2-like isoform X1 [Tachyglossus aculeatus]